MTGKSPRVQWSLGIVPVQQWLGEARRSRDLLAGSTILSWLMARLLRRIDRGKGMTTFPAFDETLLDRYASRVETVLEARVYGIPNRASGTFQGSAGEAETLFRGLEGELTAGWAEVLAEVASSAGHSSRQLWPLVGAEVSVAACPVQLVWCLQEADDADFEVVDRLYNAVKRSRVIPSHKGGAPVPKCSQCGRRESAGGAELAPWRSAQDRIADLDEVRDGLRIEVGETLCPVCLAKRFVGYMLRRPFPSTSAVAARDWRYRVRLAGGPSSHLATLEAAAGQVPGYRGETADISPLYFRRTVLRELRRARADGDRGAAKASALERVEQARRELASSTVEWNRQNPQAALPVSPSEYLAVVVFDGDDMGRRVRERPDVVPGKVADFQGKLGERLRPPAEGRPPADALALAEPFYLGGDEGLLLSPAAPVLELAAGLRGLWEDEMKPLGGDRPTLSVGVAIFDRERALGTAIDSARRALALAKSLDGKNALGVTAITASGSRWAAVERWGPAWDWPREAIALRRSGRLAHGWAHDVERFVRSLPDEAWTAGEAALGAVREEVKRLTFRRTMVLASEERARRRELGLESWNRLGGDAWWGRLPPLDVRRTLGEQLHLVSFLGRQVEADHAA